VDEASPAAEPSPEPVAPPGGTWWGMPKMLFASQRKKPSVTSRISYQRSYHLS